jgi:predicted RNA-binding protein YlqC (UPF0109 family)
VRELVEFVAKSLVDHPEQVRVTQIPGDQAVILELEVAPDDMGKVIGKEGRIANAIRSLLKIAAAREGKRAILEIV